MGDLEWASREARSEPTSLASEHGDWTPTNTMERALDPFNHIAIPAVWIQQLKLEDRLFACIGFPTHCCLSDPTYPSALYRCTETIKTIIAFRCADLVVEKVVYVVGKTSQIKPRSGDPAAMVCLALIAATLNDRQ